MKRIEKTVHVRRVPKTRSRLPKELENESHIKIGGSYDGNGTILKGIIGEEERTLMPQVINTDINDPAFYKKVENFWNDINIIVKPGKGTALNASTFEDGTPVVVTDYLKYKYLLKHSKCAKSLEDVNGSPMAICYLVDESELKQKETDLLKVRNKAKLAYLNIIEKPDVVDSIIVLLTSYKNPDMLEATDKQLVLEKQAADRPEAFIEATNNPDLELTAFVYRAIDSGVFRQINGTVFYMDDEIGGNVESAVTYLKSVKGNKILVEAKAKTKFGK
jgi:hypothetical protein